MPILTDPSNQLNRRVFPFTRLGATVRESARHTVERDLISRDLIHQLEAYVLTDHLVTDAREVHFTEDVAFLKPATWWDHFKADQRTSTSPLWRWVSRHHPARYVTEVKTVKDTRTVTFHRDHLYPEAAYHFPPNFGKPVVIEWYTESE